MNSIKIIAGLIFALVLTNLVSWKQADLYAKIRSVDPDFVQEGVASWYGPGFHGRKTANGERFNTNEMTAAHKTLPFNTFVRVTNLNNGISTVVRINDRGPFIRGRIIDLSKAAKNEIQMGGLAQVRIEIFDPEEEETEEVEDKVTPVNLFEEELPAQSKVFVEWTKDTTSLTDDVLSQFFNSSKVKIKVLTPNVADANSKIYQEVTEDPNFSYVDVTNRIKFLTGYTIEVGKFSDKTLSSELIKKLESENFKTIFLEEIIYDNSNAFRVFVGNYKTLADTKEDLVKIMNIDKYLKYKLIKIGT